MRKRPFYRAPDNIIGKLGKIASQEITIQLIESIPALYMASKHDFYFVVLILQFIFLSFCCSFIACFFNRMHVCILSAKYILEMVYGLYNSFLWNERMNEHKVHYVEQFDRCTLT